MRTKHFCTNCKTELTTRKQIVKFHNREETQHRKKYDIRSPVDRFWDKVEFTTDCWNWLVSKNKDGYGQFGVNHKNLLAHRFAYELYNDKIPKDLTIDHICKNTKCVNPHHLEVVTIGVNVLRGNGWSGVNKRKTHCINGHIFMNENLIIRPKGGRECLICRRNKLRRWRQKQKNAKYI